MCLRLDSDGVQQICAPVQTGHIKCVILGMKGFWSQLFLLPKKVMRKRESMCRNFLCSGVER